MPMADELSPDVYCLVGMPGSGKSEVARMCKIHGFALVRIGDRVWDEVKSRDLEITPDNVGKVAGEMREKEGMDVWAKRTADYMEKEIKHVNGPILLDGVRNWEEVEHFRGVYGKDMTIVAIHSSPAIRHRRLMRRGREDDSLDIEAVRARDKRELDWGIGRVIAMADHIIVNEGTIQDLEKECRDILDTLKYRNLMEETD